MELDARMDDLECRQAFQDDTCRLSTMWWSSSAALERLQLQVAALIKRLGRPSRGWWARREDEAPPPIIECAKTQPFGGFSVFRGGQRRRGDYAFRLQVLSRCTTENSTRGLR